MRNSPVGYKPTGPFRKTYGAPLGIPSRLLNGGSVTWADQLSVEARRNGADLDGRIYQVVATLTDVAGNTATATVIIQVPHDQR
ncbi:MAG TPA: hypothetical protein VE715_09200 [Blastocatellia bacterium]|nr:hypothetical protein [Blastocatellia bacterium]